MQPVHLRGTEPGRTGTSQRWFGVGHSRADDPYLRGREATRAATGARQAALVLVFTDDPAGLPELLDGVRRAVTGNPVITGCTTDGQLVPDGPVDHGVAVVAIGGDGFEVGAVAAREVARDQRAAGRAVADCLAGIESPNRVLMLLSDGLAAQHDLIRGVYAQTGAVVPLVGGCSADSRAYRLTHQFLGDADGVEILTDAVVGIGLGSTGPLGIGIAHGWHKYGDPMTLTRSEGGRIFELDGEPALDVYLARTGILPDEVDDPDVFRIRAYQHPLGLSRRSGEDIRVVHAVDREDGSLLCLADVPQGALAWPMHTDTASLIACAVDSCAQALSEHLATEPFGVLVFDCGARKARLGPQGVEAEVHGIHGALRDIPFAGFYTYGEIARVHGARGLHHMTVVSLALW